MEGPWCCAGHICCSCMCGVCMRVCGTAHQQHLRLGYFIITVLAAFFGVIFLYYGIDIMTPWEKFGFGTLQIDCHGNKKEVCYGLTTIYRESFTLVIFYFLLAFSSLQKSLFSSILNSNPQKGSCWSFKVLFISLTFITTFFIPDSFFVKTIQEIYREFCRYVSVIYLLIQLVIFIDLSDTWNSRWMQSYEQSHYTNYKHCLLFFSSGIFWVISLVTTVMNYYWFSKDTGCELQVFLITFTFALGICYTFVSLTKLVEFGSMLTSSVVNLYCVYLCWDAMTNDTDSHCNTWDNAQDTVIGIIAGLVLMGLCLLYACFRKREKIKSQSPIRFVAELILPISDPMEDEESYNEMDDGYSMKYFYLYMALLSIYFSMVLTNWGSANITNNSSKTYNK